MNKDVEFPRVTGERLHHPQWGATAAFYISLWEGCRVWPNGPDLPLVGSIMQLLDVAQLRPRANPHTTIIPQAKPMPNATFQTVPPAVRGHLR